jgi:tetratricopeptide (TPR) repeat protein
MTLGACLIASAVRAQDVADGRDSLRAGRYKEAITILSKIAQNDSDWTLAQRYLVDAYSITGRYDEAENAARKAVAGKNGRELWNSLGEVLVERGKRAAAESAFVRAGAEKASDSLVAAMNLAELHWKRGERERADKEFDHFIDVYNKTGGENLTSDELVAVARAVEYLGENDPQLFKDALKAYDRAVSTDPGNAEAKIRLGNLFLRKYNFEDAQKTFDDVLSQNPNDPRALLGQARRRELDGQPGGDSLLRASLTGNPNSVGALTLHAEMLVGLEAYDGAQLDIDHALRVNPVAERALAIAAGIKFVTHDLASFETLRQRALAANPGDAELYTALSDMVSQLRLYNDAADFAKQATVLDPKAWNAWGQLGNNELRLGQIDDGKKSLETSFKGDPYSVWVKNTLDLLDTYKNYDLIPSDHFVFMIEKDEAPILSIYLKELAERAYGRFSTTYAYTPPPPIRIEIYRSHADFSVRTVGLAGLGALGVSFGTTLAFDSPAAKDAGPFNWGSTFWHELAHTFTLGSTDHRIPRWLSEGLSVYEEHRARPGWGFNVSPGFLAAFKGGRLVPVSSMNDGFQHPAYPQQVQYSYYQASLVCELIARDYGGDAAILKMLQAYKAGQTTEQVFKSVLGVDIKTFDQKFDEYLKTRFAGILPSIAAQRTAEETSPISRTSTVDEIEATIAKAPNDFRTQLLGGGALIGHNQIDKAIPVLEHAQAMFPEYGGDDSPYALLAEAYERNGNLQKQAEVLTKWMTLTETNGEALQKLASLQEKLGNPAAAADALDRMMYVNPFDIALHQKLADLAKAAGDKQRNVREREAIVALGPVDRADAYYQLAVAQHDLGDDTKARKSLLRSLEDAPNFEKAQTLLLTLYDARHGGGGSSP